MRSSSSPISYAVDGKQYGLPLGGLLWGMFYRKDVFAEKGWAAPKTIKDLLALGVYQGIRILTAREFLEKTAADQP